MGRGRSAGAEMLITMLMLASCSSSDSGSEIGTSLACEAIAEHYPEVLTNPQAFAGELGEIIGAAENSDDAVIRGAAQDFLDNPAAAPLETIYRRCGELGYL